MPELILTTIDRAFYESLRLELVKLNLLPDIVAFENNPETYDKELAKIEKPILIKGSSNLTGKGEKRFAQISITRGLIKDGDNLIGAGVMEYERGTDNAFQSYRLENATLSVHYEIRTTARTQEEDNVMTDIIMRILGKRGYLNPPIVPCSMFYRLLTSAYVPIDDFIERVFQYEVPNVYISGRTDMGRVPQLTDIDIKTSVQ